MHKQEKCNTIVTYNASHMNNNLNQHNRFKLFSVLKTELHTRYRTIYIYIYIYIHIYIHRSKPGILRLSDLPCISV